MSGAFISRTEWQKGAWTAKEGGEMVNLYIGIADYRWFQFLTSRSNLEEINFWQPGGRTNFKAN
jgi:hypothetical protein